jgi:hypothetical protein
VTSSRLRASAIALLAVFATALVLGVLLFVLVDPGIQLVGAEELASRRSDAVAYFTLDLAFVVVYAMAGPIALWRLGRALAPANGEGRIPSWLAIAAVALVVGGLMDAVENVLLLSASSAVDPEKVRLAHLLAVPKYLFGAVGFVLSLRAVAAALRVVRGAGRA